MTHKRAGWKQLLQPHKTSVGLHQPHYTDLPQQQRNKNSTETGFWGVTGCFSQKSQKENAIGSKKPGNPVSCSRCLFNPYRHERSAIRPSVSEARPANCFRAWSTAKAEMRSPFPSRAARRRNRLRSRGECPNPPAIGTGGFGQQTENKPP